MKTWQKWLAAGILGGVGMVLLARTIARKWTREHLDDFLRKRGVL